MEAQRTRKTRPSLDAAALERLALHYVGRYATTKARLVAYLGRKIAERGWSGEAAADPAALARRFEELGYIDDAAFAEARAGSLQRRGYGERRIRQSLEAAGIEAEERDQVQAQLRGGALAAALRFASRRRIGPYAAEPLEREQREKAFAAMIRAGHPIDIVRRVLSCAPGAIPESDDG